MKRILLLPLIALILVSCSFPPFDLGLSITAATIQKMRHESTIGPIMKYPDAPKDRLIFLPAKTRTGVIDPGKGFVIAVYDRSIQFLYVQPDGKGGYAESREPAGQESPIDMPDPDFPVYAATLPNIESQIVFSRILPVDSEHFSQAVSIGMIEFFSQDPGLNPPALRSSVNYSSFVLPLQGAAIGSSDVPTRNPDSYEQVALIRIVNVGILTDTFLEGMADIIYDAAGVPPYVTTATPFYPAPVALPFLVPARRCTYFHDLAKSPYWSYASFVADGKWQTWAWNVDAGNNVHQARLNAVTGRVDALLTTGELFGMRDGIGHLYSGGGNASETAVFTLGILHFAYEAYDASDVARCYFTLMYKRNDRLYFDVYSIPTGDLAALPLS
jgi:hypothetical protein